jgi:hypothetical protein
MMRFDAFEGPAKIYEKSINNIFSGGNIMKKITLAFLILIACAFPASAQSDIDFDAVKNAGDIIEERLVDLDGDGTPEKVILKAYCLEVFENELMSYAGQLIVQKKTSGSYTNLWEGPKIEKSKLFTEEKFGFIFGQGGMEPIELIGDIYGDKVIRLFSPRQSSDVSPALYRVYAWKDNKFEFEKTGYLFENEKSAGNFKWQDKSDGKGLWVLCFTKFEGPGMLEAYLHKYDEKGGGSGGKALLKINGDGLSIIKWLEKIKKD